MYTTVDMVKHFLLVATVAHIALGDTVIVPTSVTAMGSSFSYVFEREKGAKALELKVSYQIPQSSSSSNRSEETQICCTLEQHYKSSADDKWLPLTTIFCSGLQQEYDNNLTVSVKYSKIERWDSTREHRLMFTVLPIHTQSIEQHWGNPGGNISVTMNKASTNNSRDSTNSDNNDEANEERCAIVQVTQSLLSYKEQNGIALGILCLTCFALCLGKMYRGHIIVIGCIISFVFLAAAKKLPNSEKVLGWVDANTLFLNVSMDAFAHTLCEAGLSRWLAGHILEMALGRPRRVGVLGWLLACVVSMFLPAMAALHFSSSVAYIAAETLNINPFPIVMGQAVMINIGSCVLPNDPSLYIIIKYFGIPGYTTIYNILPCAVICAAAVIVVLMFYFRKELSDETPPMFYKESTAARNDDENNLKFKERPPPWPDSEKRAKGNMHQSSQPATSSAKRSFFAGGCPQMDTATATALLAQPKFNRNNYRAKDPDVVASGIVFFSLFNIASFLYDFIGIEPGIASLFFVGAHVYTSTKILGSRFPEKLVDIPVLALICVSFIFINSLNELGLSDLLSKNTAHTQSIRKCNITIQLQCYYLLFILKAKSLTRC